MTHDQEPAERIRQLIGSNPQLTGKEVFGGLAFLIQGNMAVAASSGGGAMVRVDPAQSDPGGFGGAEGRGGLYLDGERSLWSVAAAGERRHTS